MFNDSRSFYFSADGDITHTQQRKVDRSTHDSGSDLPLWERVCHPLSDSSTDTHTHTHTQAGVVGETVDVKMTHCIKVCG